MKLTWARPLSRSASATAIAGTTWPAVPPAAITTRARSSSSSPGLAAAVQHAEFASARLTAARWRRLGALGPLSRPGGRRAARHVQDQSGRDQRYDQARAPVGDERQ